MFDMYCKSQFLYTLSQLQRDVLNASFNKKNNKGIVREVVKGRSRNTCNESQRSSPIFSTLK